MKLSPKIRAKTRALLQHRRVCRLAGKTAPYPVDGAGGRSDRQDDCLSDAAPDKGDILIDGGNTFYKDTIRRNKELSEQGFNFIGTGVSGGEEGALKGPSIMPGGQKEAYELVAPILDKIAARAEGEPCVTYIGPDGAGHYVKWCITASNMAICS